MQEQYAYQITPPPAGQPGRSISPSSSRMLASYLSDVELLLEDQRWEQALREAFDLPQIAAALSDPRMQISVERVQAWCEQWVEHGEDGAGGATLTSAVSFSSSASAQTARVLRMSLCLHWR